MRWLRLKKFLFLFFLFLTTIFFPKKTRAELYCSFYGEIININLGINNVNLSVTNDGPDQAVKVKFTNENGAGLFKITGGNANGWQSQLDRENIIFFGNTLSSGQTANFILQIQGLTEVTEDNQGINAHMSVDGLDFIECAGGRGILVFNPPPTSTPLPQPSLPPSPTAQQSSTNNLITPTSSQSSNSPTTISPTPTPTPLIDRQAPIVFLTTDFSKPFKIAPTITGKANDSGDFNPGIYQIDYSTDGGRNWLKVDKLNCSSKTNCAFEFTPDLYEDGNYQIKVRAKDLTGNYGFSGFYTLIIDRLPPQVGPIILSLNSLIIYPQNNIFYLVNDVSYNLQFKAIGGPVKIDLFAGKEKFSLTKNEENGFWKTKIKFEKPGTYELKANSIDGAKNEIEKNLGKIIVVERGKITDGKNMIKDAQIKIFVYSSVVSDFVLWSAENFNQKNPLASKNGEYIFFLPEGKYYIQIKSKNYRLWQSDIFEVKNQFILNQKIILEKKDKINLGLINLSFDFKITNGKIASKLNYENKNSLIGNNIPDFSINFNNKILNSFDIKGKNIIISFLSTYHPETSNQLKKLSKIKEYYSLVIFPQESPSLIEVFKKRGGYENEIFPDEEGVVSQAFQLITVPTHYFINDEGKIIEIKNNIN